jgi:hypothetical protein
MVTMKGSRLYRLLPIAFILLLATTVVYSIKSDPSNIRCINIGETDDSDLPSLCGWGQTRTSAYGLGSGETCRTIWEGTEYGTLTEYCNECCEIDHKQALAKIPKDTDYKPMQVHVRHLDGLAAGRDGFTVEICDASGTWHLIKTFDDTTTQETEVWYTLICDVPEDVAKGLAPQSYVCIRLTATDEAWSGYSTWGQVAFQWICLYGLYFVIPELPLGTIAATSAGVLGLFAFALRKKKFI